MLTGWSLRKLDGGHVKGWSFSQVLQ